MNEPPIRLLIPYQEFKTQIEALIKQAVNKTPNEYTSFKKFVDDWKKHVSEFLVKSFSKDKFKTEFYQSHPANKELFRIDDIKAELSKALENQKAILKNKIEWLESKLAFIKACDAIIDPDFDFQKSKNLLLQQKKELLLRKLYELRYNGGAPIRELLENNGVQFQGIGEALDLGQELYAYIDLIGIERDWWGKLTMKGTAFVEETLLKKEKEKEMQKKETKSGRIFISHSSVDKEIVNKFCDLILHIGLNIDVPKQVFNTSLEGSKPSTGEDFKIRIKKELITAEFVLQFISKNYKKSEVCLNEMGAAWVLSNKVIPLIVDKNEYDVGFIHSTTQQAQLHKEEDIFRVIDELIEEGLIHGAIKHEKLLMKVREFITWLNGRSASESKPFVIEPSNNIKPQKTNKDLSKDLQVIRAYLQSKNKQYISLEGLVKYVNSKYTLEYVLELIEEYPDRFTRVTMKGKPGLKILYPTHGF